VAGAAARSIRRLYSARLIVTVPGAAGAVAAIDAAADWPAARWTVAPVSAIATAAGRESRADARRTSRNVAMITSPPA
jgi:hypothetical protein